MSGGAIAVKNGELLRRFPLCFRPCRRSVGAPSAHSRSACASPPSLPSRQCCGGVSTSATDGSKRDTSAPRFSAAPLLPSPLGKGGFGGRGLIFLLYYFLLLWFYSTLMVLSSFVQAYKGWWRFAQCRSTTFTRCDFTLGARLAPLLSRRRRGGCAGSVRAPVRAGRRCRDGCRFRWCRCPRGRA